MLRTNDQKSGTRSCTLGNFNRTLIADYPCVQNLVFFVRSIKSCQINTMQIAAILNLRVLESGYRFIHPVEIHKIP